MHQQQIYDISSTYDFLINFSCNILSTYIDSSEELMDNTYSPFTLLCPDPTKLCIWLGLNSTSKKLLTSHCRSALAQRYRRYAPHIQHEKNWQMPKVTPIGTCNNAKEQTNVSAVLQRRRIKTIYMYQNSGKPNIAKNIFLIEDRR